MGVRKNKCFPLTEKRGADIIMSIQKQGNGVRIRRRCPAFFREDGDLMNDLIRHAQQINQQLARYGVKFGIYKNGEFHERLFPFDAIPRVITARE